MRRPIYLDYMATTPVDPRVAKVMSEYLTMEGEFGNPASTTHEYGWRAERAVSLARQQVAKLINADPAEIVWTSGATEANNLALKGAAHFYQRNGKHIITCKTEHKAVLDTCKHLETEGFEVTYLDPKPNGLLDLDTVKRAIRKNTILISIMHVNNEIGVIQDIAAIAKLAHQQGVLFHSDCAQSLTKLAIDVATMPVDLLSFSGHKIYGPKGVGALYVRRQPKRVRLEPQIHGGGHEFGMRSGTLPTHQIVGMGVACDIARHEMLEHTQRIQTLRDRLWQGLQSIPEMYLNGDMDQRIHGNLNLSFNYVPGELLMTALKDLAVSSSSACSSTDLDPSHVLAALQVPRELAHSAVRIAIGRMTTEADIDFAIQTIKDKIAQLRHNNPRWENHAS